MVEEDNQRVTGFFEDWLPAAFARLSQKQPSQSVADCSLVAEVGKQSFTLSVKSGALSVERESRLPSTFRVLTSVEAFNCLLPARDVLAQSEDKFSHMLRLDAETCRLVAAVPGALRVRVNDGDRRLEVVLGPGNADFSAPRCTATCQLADFQDLLAQRQNPMDLFLASKLVLDGDLEVALALGGLFL